MPTSTATAMPSAAFDAELAKLVEADFPEETTAVAAEAEPEEEIEAYVAKPGKRKAGSVFKGYLGKGNIASIELTVYEETFWPEWARPYIPDVDNTYVFPRVQLEAIVSFISRPNKRAAFLHGPKGTGKSSLPEQVAARLRIPLFRVNLSRDSTTDSLMGGIKTRMRDDGHMELAWAQGPIEMAAICGSGAWTMIDEFSFTPSGVNGAMQRVLERGGKAYFESKPNEHERLVTPGPTFRIFATDNTRLQGDTNGNYSGTHVQNEATIDRFQTTVEVPYMGNEHEIKLVSRKVPDCDKLWITKMVSVAQLIRTAYNKQDISLTMSPRGLIEAAEDYVFWGSDKNAGLRAFNESFCNKLSPEDAQKAREFYRKVMG